MGHNLRTPPSPFSLTGWDKEIDIHKTVQLLRTQRPGMVQTEVRVADVEHVHVQLHQIGVTG